MVCCTPGQKASSRAHRESIDRLGNGRFNSYPITARAATWRAGYRLSVVPRYEEIVEVHLTRLILPYARINFKEYPQKLFHLELPETVLMKPRIKEALLRSRRAYREASIAVNDIRQIPVWRDMKDNQKKLLLAIGDLVDAAEELPNYAKIYSLCSKIKEHAQREVHTFSGEEYNDSDFRRSMDQLEAALATKKAG